MKIFNKIVVSTVASVISFSVFADQNHKSQVPCKTTGNTTHGMPMMGGSQGAMPMMGGNQRSMGMMQSNQSGMPMMQGNQSGMPMMQGNQSGMPMMQHMQQRQAMMQAHMVKMETHMRNIEALLKELVESSKNQ